MLSQPDGPFINIAKLNLSKYAQRQNLAKVKTLHNFSGNLHFNTTSSFLFFFSPLSFQPLCCYSTSSV